jgi:hypothetical protein
LQYGLAHELRIELGCGVDARARGPVAGAALFACFDAGDLATYRALMQQLLASMRCIPNEVDE